MCTNRALVDSLECYMDDLVDCFEDFVKKSVIVISVAVGLLVAMIAYVLKTFADRTQPASGTGDMTRRSSQNFRNRNVLDSDFMLFGCQDDKGTCTNSAPCQETEKQDEKVLKDIGFLGCSKLNCGLSAKRPSLPSLGAVCKKCSVPKLSEKSKKDEKLDSCCSFCCNDKCDR